MRRASKRILESAEKTVRGNQQRPFFVAVTRQGFPLIMPPHVNHP